MSGYRDSRWISFGMPAACIVFALAMVYMQYNRLDGVRADLAQAEKKLDTLNATIKQSKSQPEGDKIPAVPATKEEDTRFLEGLKKAALETGVQLVKWTSTIRPAGAQGMVVVGSTPPPELKGITEAVGELEVFGDYAAVRAFVQRLETGPRLVNMSNVTWRRALKTGTRLQLTVIRYVTQPVPGSNAAESGLVTSSTGGSGGTP